MAVLRTPPISAGCSDFCLESLSGTERPGEQARAGGGGPRELGTKFSPATTPGRYSQRVAQSRHGTLNNALKPSSGPGSATGSVPSPHLHYPLAFCFSVMRWLCPLPRTLLMSFTSQLNCHLLGRDTDCHAPGSDSLHSAAHS